jgi:hypothetical protein
MMFGDPCAECGEPAVVGFGNPPRWLCLAHYDAALGETLRPMRDAMTPPVEGGDIPTDWQAFAADYLSGDPERIERHLPPYLRESPPVESDDG